MYTGKLRKAGGSVMLAVPPAIMMHGEKSPQTGSYRIVLKGTIGA